LWGVSEEVGVPGETADSGLSLTAHASWTVLLGAEESNANPKHAEPTK